MRVPIRGIQFILLGAFFISFLAWGMDINEFFSDASVLQYDASTKSAYWGRKLTDLGYTAYFLADVAIIELLMRIWLGKSNDT